LRSTAARAARRVSYATRATKAIAAHPYEGVERTRERLAEWRDSGSRGWPHPTTDALEERVHELVGARWPCDHDGFEEVWQSALEELRARGLEVGRGVFGGWDDADVRLARVSWCLVRALRPRCVVETGVGRGLTTRVMLEALARYGGGRLWSIDLPPLIESGLAAEAGVAVPARLRHRWTLIHGSSRRRLPAALDALGEIDLFVHDSMHTTRNLSFELSHAWRALKSTGAAVIDDVEKNSATSRFLEARPGTEAVISPSGDGAALIGVLFKRPRQTAPQPSRPGAVRASSRACPSSAPS
jgi:hypothetical protein